MLFPEELAVVRGGGDLGTGVAARLHRAGFPVVVLEIAEPVAIRRTVSAATAIDAGAVTIEDLTAQRVESTTEAVEVAGSGIVAVAVAPELPVSLPARALVDARLAKRNIDTRIDQAPFVVGLGPGFTAGSECHAVVETARGPRLGRVIWEGAAQPNTGLPGIVGGEAARRVIRAPGAGLVSWTVEIGDTVEAGTVLGSVEGDPVRSEIAGVVRGLIAAGRRVEAGLKLADIDPRGEISACFEISDKALAVGGGVLEAILVHLNRR